MNTFEIILTDGASAWVHEVDSYQMEGPLTTFFRSGTATLRLGSFSERIASFRTDAIACIRQHHTLDAISA